MYILPGHNPYNVLELLITKPNGTFNYKITKALSLERNITSYTMYSLMRKGYVDRVDYGKYKINQRGIDAFNNAKLGIAEPTIHQRMIKLEERVSELEYKLRSIRGE